MDWKLQNFSLQWSNSKSNSANLFKELGLVVLRTFKNSSGAVLWVVRCLSFLCLLHDPMIQFILHMKLEVYLFKWWREYLGLALWHWERQLHTESSGWNHVCTMNAEMSTLLSSWPQAAQSGRRQGESSPWNTTSLREKCLHTLMLMIPGDSAPWTVKLGTTALPLCKVNFSSFSF